MFNLDIDQDVVRRVLSNRYRPDGGNDGPSWLSFLGSAKDSLWSVDLFRCESLSLRTHWVMLVMDKRRFVYRGRRHRSADDFSGKRIVARFTCLWFLRE